MELFNEVKRWQKLAGLITEAEEASAEAEETPTEEPAAADTPNVPSGVIDKATAKQLIKDTKGKFFTVTFIKKDGTTRIMNARLGVKAYLRGGELPYNPEEKGLIPVYDVKTKDYRMININTITNLKIGTTEYQVR
jgi:hypothetical protein